MENNNKSSTSALVGLIIGIIALVLSAVPIVNNFAAVLAVVSLIFGIVAMSATKNGKRKGRGKAKATIIISVIAFVVVIGSQAFYSSVLDEAGKEINNSLDKATGEKTEDLLGKEVDVNIGKFESTTGEFGIVTTKLPVSITNKNAEAKSYSIQIEAVGADGVRIMDETIYANNLGPNQTQQYEQFQYVDSAKLESLKTATFKTMTVSQY